MFTEFHADGDDTAERLARLVSPEAPERRHPSTLHLLGFFGFDHLPQHLQATSRQSARLAVDMVEKLKDGPELTTGLRKLLEAKDCFVRAAL